MTEMFEGNAQLVPGALRGYRTWTPNGSGLLASTGLPHVWGAPSGLRPEHWDWLVRSGTAPEFAAARNPERAICLRDSVPCPCPACSRGADKADHEAPNADCRCGIYGWYDPADTRIVQAPIFGAIEATGRTIIGTHGFRTSLARVLAIAATGDRSLDLRLSARGYRVLPLRDDVVELYPPDDLRALVDHTCDEHCHLVKSMSGVQVRVIASNAAVMQADLQKMLLTMQAKLAKSAAADFQRAASKFWTLANPTLTPPAEESTRDRALRLRRERNAGARPWLPSSLWRKAMGE